MMSFDSRRAELLRNGRRLAPWRVAAIPAAAITIVRGTQTAGTGATGPTKGEAAKVIGQ
jgi:hypothetical protein